MSKHKPNCEMLLPSNWPIDHQCDCGADKPNPPAPTEGATMKEHDISCQLHELNFCYGGGPQFCTCGADMPTPPAPQDCECNEGYGPCGRCASCRPDLYTRIGRRSVLRSKSRPTDSEVREARERTERIRELEADLDIMTRARDLEQDLRRKAEAELARVTDWARGRCECCGTDDMPDGTCYAGDGDEPCKRWTPAWGK